MRVAIPLILVCACLTSCTATPQFKDGEVSPVHELHAALFVPDGPDLELERLEKAINDWRLVPVTMLASTDAGWDVSGAAGFQRMSTMDGLVLQRSGKLIVPVQLSQANSRLELAVSAGTSASELGASLAASFVSTATGKTHDLRDIGSRATQGVPNLLGGSVSVPAVGDSNGCVILDLELRGPDADIRVDGLRVLEEEDPADTPTMTRQVAARPRGSSPPDIVIIVLDAARADHFGAYGYDRATTPNIDALARSSLIFSNAFASAPYTLSSMPTMITGIPSADHGMVAHGNSLPDEITTLAEYLARIGYETVCYSGNGYNSIAQGLGQGCGEFEEFWRGVPPVGARDPYRISDRAVQRIERHAGTNPLFMLLHYVPPHEPYAPQPRFDIFGAGDYRGSIDGSSETIRAIDMGDRVAAPADIFELMSLYDGNLLTADDAAEQVLAALRRRERWENTVVLIVSDHGEAFGEHGRMSHNSTLYDEMLHVPFILRLPESDRPEAIDTRQLVSLEDVTPTMLGLVGVMPDPQVSGVDLLSGAPRVPGSGVRLQAPGPIYGYRTLSHKVISRYPVGGELYDLRSDPGEQRNIVREDPDLFLCLSAIMHEELASRSSGPQSENESNLDQEDLDALRALGYVD